jgi:hypothetical protein
VLEENEAYSYDDDGFYNGIVKRQFDELDKIFLMPAKSTLTAPLNHPWKKTKWNFDLNKWYLVEPDIGANPNNLKYKLGVGDLGEPKWVIDEVKEYEREQRQIKIKAALAGIKDFDFDQNITNIASIRSYLKKIHTLFTGE